MCEVTVLFVRFLDVEASEARAPLLTRRAADAQPTSRPPHRSLPAAGSASTPLTGHRAQRFLPQKTVVEFPQKAPFVFRKPGAKSEATQKGRNGAPNSSSSSSSSSSSDSESDDEGDRPEAGPGVRNKRHGGSLKPKTSPEEEARAQKPHTGVARPSQQQGSPAKPSVSREARPTTTRPTPRVEAEAKHSVTERQPQKAATLAEGNPEKHAQVSADGPKSGSSAPATGEAGVRAPLPTAPSTAPGMRREPDGLWGTAGRVAATSESVAAEAPQRDTPALPAEEEDASMAPALVLQPQEESGALEQSAMQGIPQPSCGSPGGTGGRIQLPQIDSRKRQAEAAQMHTGGFSPCQA